MKPVLINIGLTHKDYLLRLGVRVKRLRRERQRSTERSRRSPNGVGLMGFEDLYTYIYTPIHPSPNP